MLNSINLLSLFIGFAVATFIFNLLLVAKAYYKKKVARDRLVDAKKKMADIDKQLKENQGKLEDILKNITKE